LAALNAVILNFVLFVAIVVSALPVEIFMP